MPGVEALEPLFLIEYRRVLAPGLAVVAPHADEIVVGQPGAHVEQLGVEHLLGAEDVETFEVDQSADVGTAAFPAVAFAVVFVVLVAHVERGDGEVLRRSAGDAAQDGDEQGEQSFHKASKSLWGRGAGLPYGVDRPGEPLRRAVVSMLQK